MPIGATGKIRVMDKTPSKEYDLEERISVFGESIVLLCRSIKPDYISRPLIDQLVRSATSVGANYMEANGSSSRRDFRNKAHICKKESQETCYWLRILSAALPERKHELRNLWQESHEFVLIFQKITSSLRN
jgi:four helix bundle protein